MGRYDIELTSLVEGCREYWLDKRIIIIPNCSDDYSLLTYELDKQNLKYLVDNGKSELQPRDDFYVIDFRQINLIQ